MLKGNSEQNFAPSLSRAAEKISEKINEMDGSFADFAGGALEKTEDGLGMSITG